jgi:hypothetical protein
MVFGNEEKHKNTKGRHEFPYGDFENVHRCGVLTAESRAGQCKYFDIENAAAHLHGMIDAKHANIARQVPGSIVSLTRGDQEARSC